MVKIKRKKDGNIKMTLTSEEYNAIVAYVAVGKAELVEKFSKAYKLPIDSFWAHFDMLEAMLDYVSTDKDIKLK